ncbi:MAG: ABC transporter ATP-binding protein [Chitinophagaceae bacterium]|nr:MAG: ABC transporter ATP-binding protein [Chitinophagaceae bacterium]
MLTVNSLTVSYGKTTVLDNLNLEAEEGMIHGLAGINGSGKTTLFHTIYGFIKPDTGSIQLNGQPLSRKKIALLETQHYFYSNIKGKEYLNLFPDPGGTFSIEPWQELFRLPLDDLIEDYSTGMKKKLALTGILKLDKPILLLDEPFNGIDMEAVRIIQLLLVRLKEKGKTIIITSHILETLTSICDHIHILENKNITRNYRKSDFEKISQYLFGEMEEQLRNKINLGL